MLCEMWIEGIIILVGSEDGWGVRVWFRLGFRV